MSETKPPRYHNPAKRSDFECPIKASLVDQLLSGKKASELVTPEPEKRPRKYKKQIVRKSRD